MAVINEDHSDSEHMSIVEESSAELKISEHSRQLPPPKSSMKRISEDFNSNASDIAFDATASGLQDELSSVQPVPHTSTKRDGRSSDFHYTGNSGLALGNATDPAYWERTKKRIQQFRRWCGKVVNNEKVQYAIVACIFINAAMMGVATYGFIKTNDYASDIFEQADLFFLIIFTIELLFQFIHLGPRLLLDGWLVFDLIVIIPSWFAVAPSNGMANYQIIRAFRIFRALRLVTRVKIMKDLIVAILSVMPRMVAIFMMLLLIFYIFAVMFTQLYSEATYSDPPNPEMAGQPIVYFQNLEQSMLTLFQLMTMDEWAVIVRELAPQHRSSWVFLIIFVVISGFIVVNLIVAVICDAIGNLSDPEKARWQGAYDDDTESTKIELREQIDTIEDQIGDLTRIQARTFHTLQYLTQQLRVEKEKSTSMRSQPDTPPDDILRRDSGDNKDKRSNMMRKTNSAERSRRKGFAQTGFVSKRKNYTDTWTQEGSDKSLRKAMITNFAKSARELQKMREREESTANFAKSLRELKAMREEEALREEEEDIRKEEQRKEEASKKTMGSVISLMQNQTSIRQLKLKDAEEERIEEEKKKEEASKKTMGSVISLMQNQTSMRQLKLKDAEEEKRIEEEKKKEESNKKAMSSVISLMQNQTSMRQLKMKETTEEEKRIEEEKREEEEKRKEEERQKEEADKKKMSSVIALMQSQKSVRGLKTRNEDEEKKKEEEKRIEEEKKKEEEEKKKAEAEKEEADERKMNDVLSRMRGFK